MDDATSASGEEGRSGTRGQLSNFWTRDWVISSGRPGVGGHVGIQYTGEMVLFGVWIMLDMVNG